MEFRSYDPAIGRFNGIDPVTHFSQGTSVAFDNNPVFWADPSGADAGSWRAAHKNGFTEYGYGWQDDHYGIDRSNTNESNEDELISGIPIYDIEAILGGDKLVFDFYRQLANNDIMLNEVTLDFGADFSKEQIESITNDIYASEFYDFNHSANEGVSFLGGLGTFNGSVSSLSGPIGSIEGTFAYVKNRKPYFKYYNSGWIGGSTAKIKTISFTNIGNSLGGATFGLGLVLDGIGLKNYYDLQYPGDFVTTPLKAGANQSLGLYSLFGRASGMGVGIMYFGLETFYPGGTAQALTDYGVRNIRHYNLTGEPIIPYNGAK